MAIHYSLAAIVLTGTWLPRESRPLHG